MYQDITTLCWSIKEVNRNLRDREDMSAYSIKYLNKACLDLSTMLASNEDVSLDENIEVVDKSGNTKNFTIGEVAEMLSDAKKIIEYNLIDNINKWAQLKAKNA